MNINLKNYINEIPDFPIEGILYKDIQPLLQNSIAFNAAVSEMYYLVNKPDYWVGVESRGFIFASALAIKYGGGVKLIRKPGKLPNKNIQSVEYKYEYSEGKLEMSMGSGTVVIVDDVFATGGTIEASEELANTCGYDVIDKVCLVDLGISSYGIKSVIQY